MNQYNKEEIFEQALQIAIEKKILFIDELCSHLPISRQTFYSYFPLESDSFNTIKEILCKNKIHVKCQLREMWLQSLSPVLQIALYKLIASPEERKILADKFDDEKESNVNIVFEWASLNGTPIS